ncbi:MAG: polyribonucleotide nucleotidyltransferase [Bacillota bacterium]
MQQIRKTLTKSMDLAGRKLTIETGRLATQASGSVLVKYGDTVVLVTAVGSPEPREGIDFFPLTVDYEERLYAVGRIPGGFIKREGRPTEKAILSSRLIDRPLRPLFPKGYRNDVHIVATVLSVDQDNQPDVVAMIGASAALHLSQVPFLGPIGGVNVGRVREEIMINPSLKDTEESDLRLIVAGTGEGVMMVEAGAQEVPEEVALEAIMQGHAEIQRLVKFIEEFREEALQMGLARPKEEYITAVKDMDLETRVRDFITERLRHTLWQVINERPRKLEREQIIDAAKDNLLDEFLSRSSVETDSDDYVPDNRKQVKELIRVIEKELVRQLVTVDRVRVDGRKLEEIRPIFCQVGILPRTHGTGLFTRGETQVMTVTTLGAVGDEQILDGLGVEDSKRYMHHYNFPPYSVGEARFMRGPGRREIGHGALAERALEPMLPSEEDFPYTIRLVSEVLESNGSSSMGSVCGSTLSLMDAGVPIKSPVAGVAMGLIKEKDAVAILTDIQGIEDALGDMDFKVAGTNKGITALQMDIKNAGINREILSQALAQAKEGRLHILEIMLEALPEPRKELSLYAPRIIRTLVDPDRIRDIIGPGGKIIKKIIEETGAKIDIEDDGRVFIAAVDGEAGNKAMSIIRSLTQDVETGKIYTGRVTRVMDFGAFVEIIPGVLGLPGKEGMVHISQLAEERVGKVEDVVKEGEQVMVKAIGFDPQGRLKLSRKEALRSQRPNQPRPNTNS